jgi:hypothetical protein
LFLSFEFGLLGSHSSKPWAGEMKNAFIQQHRTTTVCRFIKKLHGGSRRVATTGKMNY